MKKILLILCFLVVFTINTGIKSVGKIPINTVISGKVIDFTSDEALVGVEVGIEGEDNKVYTDFDGNFKIKHVKNGSCNLRVSYISYNKRLIENVGSKVNVKLQPVN